MMAPNEGRAEVPRVTVVMDCNDADKLSEFWAAALGYERRPRVEQFVALVPPAEESGAGTPMILQEVPEPKSGKNRVHVDLHVADLEAEVRRLEGLGATRRSLEPVHLAAHPEVRWVVMADPEGNEFCVAPEPSS
jgi:predicted enzyme related to lactoylglutathione lyase